jgi:hypothetical protein
MKRIVTALLPFVLAGCAIEGVGWQGHVDAYNNAAAAGREYASLNRGARDSAWYAGWCAAIEPHFARMSDVHGRVERYCQAMQAQPESAEAIRADLVATLNAGGSSATSERNSAYTAVGAAVQTQQAEQQQQQRMQQAKQFHCTTQQFGTQTTTDCR